MIICYRENDQVNSMFKLEIMREYFVHLKRFEIVKKQGADCGGQTTRLSPLRFRVRSPVRFILMWTRI